MELPITELVTSRMQYGVPLLTMQLGWHLDLRVLDDSHRSQINLSNVLFYRHQTGCIRNINKQKTTDISPFVFYARIVIRYGLLSEINSSL